MKKIFSIKLKILLLILVSIVAISGVVLAFIIPNAKSAVTTATENNMQDIVSLSSKLVDDQINLNGIDSVDATVLGTIFDGVGIEGVDSSYVYVVDENKMFIYHPKEEKIGTEVFNTTVSDLVDSIPSGNYEKEKIFHYTDENGVVKYAAYCVSDLSGWTTVIVGNEDDALATINSLQSGSILIIAICAILLLLVGIFIAIRITKPISIMTGIIERTSNLDFTHADELNALMNANDETGVMSSAVYRMQSSLRDMIGNLNTISGRLSENAGSLDSVSVNINSASTDNAATTQELAASMQETSATATTIDSNMNQIMDNTNAISKKSQEGLVMAKEISGRAAEMNHNAISASDETVKMYTQVKAKNEQAIEQSKSVDKVNDLASSIQEIADQTGLLSLNASIEAARAGEAGKGFAVVASEISNLASQSTNTVKQIIDIVAEVNTAVSNMGECMESTLDFLENKVMNDYKFFVTASEKYDQDANNLNDSMTDISNLIGDLSESAAVIVDAVSGISSTISDAAEGVSDVAGKTTDIVTLSDNVIDVVKHTENSSKELNDIVEAFKL